MDNVKTVETIRALCKKKKTSLTRLEEKLGFSNGYIGKMAKRPSSPPYDKLVAIANELGVTVADLTGESVRAVSGLPCVPSSQKRAMAAAYRWRRWP